MEGCKTPVYLTTLFAIFYTISPFLGIPDAAIVAMFFLSPFIVLWMVLSILINGKESGREFSEGYWYDDMDAYK